MGILEDENTSCLCLNIFCVFYFESPARLLKEK